MYTDADKHAYWDKKSENSRRAKEHTERMEREYRGEINESAAHTTEHNAKIERAAASAGETQMSAVSVVPLDSVSAIFEYTNRGKTAVLNFASYKNPGGRFIDGSMAQEESLCHESFLYNVLRRFEGTYYANNNNDKNKALYRDKALYSPDIRFFKGNRSTVCDVITCACPNKTAAHKYQNVSNAENLKVLQERCDFVLSVAQEHSVETLILGAYGCGVFGQDPAEVAQCFANSLKKHHFNRIVFAIPNKGAGARNFEPFAKAFYK